MSPIIRAIERLQNDISKNDAFDRDETTDFIARLGVLRRDMITSLSMRPSDIVEPPAPEPLTLQEAQAMRQGESDRIMIRPPKINEDRFRYVRESHAEPIIQKSFPIPPGVTIANGG